MSHKIFIFDKLSVFFKHTDYHGFVHPYNFFEWMSYTREAYFQELIPNFLELTKRDVKMVTVDAQLNVNDDAIFGDHVIVEIYSENVKRLSFDVIFDFFTQNKKIANGRQTITFIDAGAMRPTRIPDELRLMVIQYEKKFLDK